MKLWIAVCLLTAVAEAQTWVTGEIGFRLTIIPKDCPAERAGLRIGDILADPVGVRPALNGTGELPVYRFNTDKGTYSKGKVKVSFRPGEERRLGVTGDLGFLITAIDPKSMAEQAGLKVGDFLPQIDESFVHEVKDLALVDRAAAEGREVRIHVTRWVRGTFEKSMISRRLTQ